MKTINFSVKDVKLIVDNKEVEEMAASAAISLNPHVTWLKVVLTDDMPNANRQRIPRSEFASVLRTGVFMPLKMSNGEIKDGHDDAYPIGTFAHLKTEANTIEGLVALWNREREEDIDLLKQRHEEGKPIDVSWEVTYTDEEFDEESSVTSLLNVSMNGACIVGMPAYEGRTTVTALSSENKDKNKSSEPKGDNSNMDEDTYKSQIQELETKVEDLKAKLSEADTKISEIEPKYEELAAFKENYDAEQEKLSKIQTIKDKFSASQLELTDEYIDEKIDTFLAMSEDQLDFFVQELSAFSANDSKNKDDEGSNASVNLTSDIPNISRKETTATKEGLVDLLNSLD